MPNQKVSAMTAVVAGALTDIIPAVRGGANIKITVEQLLSILTIRKFLWATGRYYGTTPCQVATATATNNLLYFTPIWVPTGAAIDRIVCEVTTGVAATTGRLAVYASSPTTMLPTGSPLIQATGIDLSTTGVKESTIAYTFSSGGLYWLGFVAQGGAPTMRSISGTQPEVSINSTTAMGSNNSACHQSGVSGELPAVAAIGAQASWAPRILVRAA